MKEIKNNPYSIARSTLQFLFPFSFQVELEKNVNHDLGWWIHPVHLFYVVTNFYYFPYYVMKADIAPYAVRLVSHFTLGVLPKIPFKLTPSIHVTFRKSWNFY